MDADLFLVDLEAKPHHLNALAAHLEAQNPWRGSTVVALDADVPGALCLRYPGDDSDDVGSDDVSLLTEVLVAELVSARAWAAARDSQRAASPE